MNVYIRTDASIQIGSGHIMRCLTLAKQLKAEGMQVTFICRNVEGHMIDYICNQGFNVQELPKIFNNNVWGWTKENWSQDASETSQIINDNLADLLIVDHYSLDKKWEGKLRNHTKKLMVIDDLANRVHDCDVLLDQNYYKNFQGRYKNLVPENCILCLGPNYLLLRDEFWNIKISKFQKGNQRIFVFFGSVDATNETEKALIALQKLSKKYHFSIDVVVGDNNKNKILIEDFCKEINNCHYYCQINNMAELMSKATFSLGAGGTITWERAFLNLPSLVISVADNQDEIAQALNDEHAIMFLGKSSYSNEEDIYNAVEKVLKDDSILKELSMNMKKIINKNVVEQKPLLSILRNLKKEG
ncbi:UDP-2,4-diacetamido-2,4,6-trideoxy-beta-L-altropyranose hydrolase [Rummeliibacillus pycnus]|uniref:UDP-2,4-diacetamido-2,4, 6-trideoxy-beta-L-altropyranose hydrolase n=1 Tax=Rummeliibacillus pycnus TaxID=101070 RepID=UPI000C9AD4B0|nr:UDP-2,4-diacetamido-2,4,6-trideoxy-beta-L-altropyranose hydrolase [Rummeliibacillus pycnus]